MSLPKALDEFFTGLSGLEPDRMTGLNAPLLAELKGLADLLDEAKVEAVEIAARGYMPERTTFKTGPARPVCPLCHQPL